MYKYLLVAINAKYIHSNLGIYSIGAYLKQHNPNILVEKLECNINHNLDKILEDIYESKADAVGFSTYIWNSAYVLLLISNLKKLCPQIKIILGGPEVTYKARRLMESYPEIDVIIKGEGENISSMLLDVCSGEQNHQAIPNHQDMSNHEKMQGVPGICYRHKGVIFENQNPPPMDMDELPFVYPDLGKDFMEHRIIYYESSRGCPFCCSYCLSSIGSDLKFRSVEKVKKEIQYFLDNRVAQVKFVDRTFNAKKSRTLEILRYLKEMDNGITNFHFEIEGDILSAEEIDLLSGMRTGQVQLEIGVQTTNVKTLQEIRRFAKTEKLEENMRRLREKRNIHLHLDLIAGLPYETFDSFVQSFNRVYAMQPDGLQLGFLKVLDGSYMWEMEKEYGIVRFDTPPYEILCNRWISYSEILRLKAVEEMLEVYFNSRQFEESIRYLERLFPSAFAMFDSIASYYKKHHLFDAKHSRLGRYEILFDFITELYQTHLLEEQDVQDLRDTLLIDLYQREKVKSRPQFSPNDRSLSKEYKGRFRNECIHRGLKNHEAHLEVLTDGRLVFFDYTKKNPLSNNATFEILPAETMMSEVR